MQQADAKQGESPVPSTKSAPGPVDTRTPLPSSEARRASVARVKEIFADDYTAAITPAKKAEFAKRLAEQALQTQDVADRWALLTESLRMATEAGDVATALPLIDRIPSEFAVERHASRIDALTRLATKAAPPLADQVASVAIDVARDADRSGDADTAAKAVTLASTIARKTKNPVLMADAARLQQKSKERQRVAKELEPLLEKVAAAPADPDANMEAGRALCLKADRWSQGLPLLSKGSDATLAQLARAELAKSATPKDRIRLADGWWEWGEGQKAPWKQAAMSHAASFYSGALNEAEGLDRARLERRITSAAMAAGGSGKKTPLADLPELSAENTAMGFSKNGTFQGNEITCQGQKYPRAIVTHPSQGKDLIVRYQLPPGTIRLEGRVGIFSYPGCRPDAHPVSPVVFELRLDGEAVWTSPEATERDRPVAFNIPVKNSTRLELRTRCLGAENAAWAAWLDPMCVQ